MTDLVKFQKLECLENDNVNKGLNLIIQSDFMLNYCATTRLLIPNPPEKLVKRQRLFDRLDDITNKKLTVISAPAGFGKTTLISEWAINQSEMISVAWVSLSEEDNEVYSFWSYVIASLKENLEKDTEGYLLDMYSNKNYKIENFINVLINKILLSNKEMVIILDDFHLIRNKLVNQSLTYFLSHMPNNIHVVLSTRNKPEIPISKLRIKEELLEIKTDDTRFNKEEICELFEKVFDIKLTKSEIEIITSSTEGWVSALKVIALYMKSNGNHSQDFAIEKNYYFSEHIFDYLTEEIINKYPKSIKDFLYKTSIFKFLNSSICNKVLQIDNSQEILDLLIQNNTFITSLSDKHDYFRYQHVFAEFLKNNLKRYYFHEIDELYLKASSWYEENGYFYEAIDASAKSKDFENCARLLDLYINKILDYVELQKLIRVIKSLPIEIIKLKPRICVFYSCALAIMGKMQEDQYLDNIGINLESEEFESYRAFIYSIKALDAYRKESMDPMATFEYAKKALDILSEEDPLSVYVKIFSYNSLGTLSSISGNFEEANHYLDLSKDSLGQTNSLICLMLVVIQNAVQLSIEGKMEVAIELFQITLSKLEEKKQHRYPCINIIHLCISLAYYEIDEIDKAYESIHKTIELSKVGNDKITQLCSYIMLSKILFVKGKVKDAVETVKSIEETDYSDSMIHVFRYYRTDWITTIINFNDPSLLSKISKKFQLDFSDEINFDKEENNLAAVEILIFQNKLNEAEENLVRLFEYAKQQNRRWSIVKLSILHAIIKKHQGEMDAAIILFRQAINYSMDCGYIRTFIDFGKEVEYLLIELLKVTDEDSENSKVRNYIIKLLSKIGQEPCESNSEKVMRSTNDLFSPREIEVLESIVEGLTNDEISRTLYISTSTVKKHIKSIYVKLNVNNRTKAIKIAKQMKVI